VKVRLVLLDRGFFKCRSRALLAGGSHTVLDAVKAAGRPPRDQRKARTSARRFFEQKRGGWASHTWRGGKRTRTTGDRAGLHLLPELRWLEAKAWPLRLGLCLLGFHPGSNPVGSTDLPTAIRIETSYRQDGAGSHPHHHPRSAAAAAVCRDRAAAAQCLGLAASMRLASRHGAVVTLHLELLRFTDLLLKLQTFAEQLLGPDPLDPSQLPSPQPLAANLN